MKTVPLPLIANEKPVPAWLSGPLRFLPALTIRQPWATSIVHFGKRIENRIWTGRYLKAQLSRLEVGGQFLIHAGKEMSDQDLDGWRELIAARPACRPTPEQIREAGINTLDELPCGGVNYRRPSR